MIKFSEMVDAKFDSKENDCTYAKYGGVPYYWLYHNIEYEIGNAVVLPIVQLNSPYFILFLFILTYNYADVLHDANKYFRYLHEKVK